MDDMKQFFANLVEEHLGAMIAAVLLFIAIIAAAIFLSLKIKRRKKELAEKEYKEELSKISKEELDNIAGNVSNPEALYESFAAAETTESLKDGETAPATETEAETSGDKTQAENKNGETVGKPNAGNGAQPEDGSAEIKNGEGKISGEPKPAANAETHHAKQRKAKTAKSSDGGAKHTAQPAEDATQPRPDEVVTETPTEVKPVETASVKRLNKNTAANVETKPAASKKQTAKATNESASEKPTAKITDKPAEAKPVEARKQTYAGKWVIAKSEDGKYYAKLLASNGGTLLETENYSSLTGVKNGIQTIKKNVDGGNFATTIDKYGRYRFKLFSMSNRLICQSEEYSSKAKCENGINSVKRFAKTETLIREDLND